MTGRPLLIRALAVVAVAVALTLGLAAAASTAGPRTAGGTEGVTAGSGVGPSVAAPPVTLTVDRTHDHVAVGRRASFELRLRNRGAAPLTGAIAHLNVMSLDPSVYVDPEDWSQRRTVYLGSIPAGDSLRVPWRIQAVNAGRFFVYVSVSDPSQGEGVASSPAVLLTVDAASSLDTRGSLVPVAGIPAFVLVLLVGTRWRRRRAVTRTVPAATVPG